MQDEERAAIEREVRTQAIKRVRAKLGLYWHLLLFVLVNAAIAAINLHYDPQHLWFVWPLGAWGTGLLLHAFATLQGRGMSQDMVQAEIRRELARRGVS